MKIGVVGGTGNISASFVKLLAAQGHEVVCFNRGHSPSPVRVITGDRANEPEFEAAMQRERFDAAIDMICFNAQQAASSVRAFRGVKHFVQCSTVCTYGIQSDWLPVTEDHPLRPISDYGRNKVAADEVFLSAYRAEGFPVTIIKPSTTYGPKLGLLRQVAWEFGWIDRVRKGKPILVCDEATTRFQFLHVNDAALCFANIVGKQHTVGQVYNLVRQDCITWADYHRLAMRVIGREVELVGVPLADLQRLQVPNFTVCAEIFAYDGYYSPAKLMRDVPEFQPRIELGDGMREVLAAMDADGRIPDSDAEDWEDRIIATCPSAKRLLH